MHPLSKRKSFVLPLVPGPDFARVMMPFACRVPPIGRRDARADSEPCRESKRCEGMTAATRDQLARCKVLTLPIVQPCFQRLEFASPGLAAVLAFRSPFGRRGRMAPSLMQSRTSRHRSRGDRPRRHLGRRRKDSPRFGRGRVAGFARTRRDAAACRQPWSAGRRRARVAAARLEGAVRSDPPGSQNRPGPRPRRLLFRQAQGCVSLRFMRCTWARWRRRPARCPQ